MTAPHIDPCPFCGSECYMVRSGLIRCTGGCYYSSGIRSPSAIGHHNRVSAAANAAPRHVDHQPLHEPTGA